MRNNKKGVVTLMIVFFISAIVIVLISSVLAPLGVLFNTKMYEAGDMILAYAQEDLDSISDANISSQIDSTIQEARDAGITNIEVNSDIFQYGWVIVLVLAAIVVFLFSRQLVEYGAGFI